VARRLPHVKPTLMPKSREQVSIESARPSGLGRLIEMECDKARRARVGPCQESIDRFEAVSGCHHLDAELGGRVRKPGEHTRQGTDVDACLDLVNEEHAVLERCYRRRQQDHPAKRVSEDGERSRSQAPVN
jgi:hypothetical protein